MLIFNFLVVFILPLVVLSTSIYSGRLFSEECNGKSLKDSTWLSRAPEEFVNIFGGTNSRYDLSHGSTLPLITRPWGFNSYAPQTDDDPTWPGWWFHPSDRRFFGVRVTHQPSPWIADYGNFLIKAYMPSNTNPSDKTDNKDGFSGYNPKKSEFHPYYFSTNLFAYGNSHGNMKIELVPTSHGGIYKASFPEYIKSEVGNDGDLNDQIRRIAITLTGNNADHLEVIKSPIDGTTMISGYTKVNSGGVGDSSTSAFAHYFVLAIYNGAEGNDVTSFDTANVNINGAKNVWVNFAPDDAKNQVLTVRFATSFISTDQALTNLMNEVSVTKSFDDLHKEAKAEWNGVLSRVKITKPPALQDAEGKEGYDNCQLRDLYSVFYSSLYRASIFPRQISEINKDGQEVHWSPYAKTADARVKSGPLSTDSGFWDAWNTIYPLLSLVNRPVLGKTMQGWLSAYDEGQWLPKWASPGYRGSMIGTMGDVSLADAIVNKIPNFDREKAYEAIRKDAFEVPPTGVEGVGRVCLSSYLQNGYVPRNAPATDGTCSEVVARTLNYYQSDYAIAQAAKTLGKTDDVPILEARYSNFSLIFDSNTGFFRSKSLSDGKFTMPFDQYAWGGDYTEAGPWQFRFYLPYDPAGLADLYKSSGRDMCKELLNAQTDPYSTIHIGGYGSEIHEQTEMPDHCWGQYAHNNQPSHHMLYMHMYDGYQGACSNQGRYWIRETLLKLYTADANMFPGDEDNGEMGAWFVLSAMGLYQRSPGSGDFELGVPLFGEMEVDISDLPHPSQSMPLEKLPAHLRQSKDRKVLKIVAKNNSYENSYVQRVLWNDEVLPSSTNSIAYEKLAQGGVLTFEMGPNSVSVKNTHVVNK